MGPGRAPEPAERAGSARPGAPRGPLGLRGRRPERSQVLLTRRTAHIAEDRVSIAVVLKQNPTNVTAWSLENPGQGGTSRVRSRRKDLAPKGTLKMVSFSGVFAPIIHRNNSNLKIVLFSALSSF